MNSFEDETFDRKPEGQIDETDLTAGKLELEITRAERVGEGMGAYVVYKIEVKTDLKYYHQKNFSALRRYNDFLWLRDRFAEQFRGYIIPPLPEKSLTDRFNPEFVEYRRKELERFLLRVVAHPLLSTSSYFQDFLEAKDESYQQKKTSPSENKSGASGSTGGANSTGGGGSGGFSSFANFFGMKVAAIQTTLAGAVEIDSWFEYKTQYVNNLEHQLTLMSDAVASYALRQIELMESFHELAVCSNMLSNTEKGNDDELAKSFAELAQANCSIQPCYQDLCLMLKLEFEDVLRDYLRYIGAVKEILKYRYDRLAVYQDLALTIQSKKDTIEKRREAATISIAGAESELQSLEKQRFDEEKNFQAISSTCRAELEKWEKTMGHEIRLAITSFAQKNLDHTHLVRSAWKEVLDKIKLE